MKNRVLYVILLLCLLLFIFSCNSQVKNNNSNELTGKNAIEALTEEQQVYSEFEDSEYAKAILRYCRLVMILPENVIITQFQERFETNFYLQAYVPNNEYDRLTEVLLSRMDDVSFSSKTTDSSMTWYENIKEIDWWKINNIDDAVAKYYKCFSGINYGDPKGRTVMAFVFEDEISDGYWLYMAY